MPYMIRLSSLRTESTTYDLTSYPTEAEAHRAAQAGQRTSPGRQCEIIATPESSEDVPAKPPDGEQQ